MARQARTVMGLIVENLNWVQILAGFASGGAMGSLLTAMLNSYNGRIQPVGYRIEPLSMFKEVEYDRGIKVKVSLADGNSGQSYNLSNLHAVDVELVNRGNKDLPCLRFGVTLSRLEKAVLVKTFSKDRHHIVTASPSNTPANPTSELDFEVTPLIGAIATALLPISRCHPGKTKWGLLNLARQTLSNFRACQAQAS